MGKRLTDCITSQYIGAANRLNSKKARRRIVAYVESYDDIFFWRSVLTRFENEERYFEVLLPSRLEHLERGKKAAIMSISSGCSKSYMPNPVRNWKRIQVTLINANKR
jgi:hypothetical protein